MGMFDEIDCKLPLPGYEKGSKYGFQTKSLHCELERYTITKEGRLLRRDGSDMNYRGIIHFYDIDDPVSYDYYATFVDGQIEEVEGHIYNTDKEETTDVSQKYERNMTREEWVARAAACYAQRVQTEITPKQAYHAACKSYTDAVTYDCVEEGPEYCVGEDLEERG